MKLIHPSGSFSGNSSMSDQYGGKCLWLIQIQDNQVVLEINYMNISSTDYIKVYDGYTQSSPLLLDKTFGFGPLLPILSSGRNVLIEFVSKSTFSEFNATYNTVSVEW
ncbi:embryonic protein UVS.2-like [Engystomops pustulosus]|uniref:embryonic protein UVS.2-like n=1 Tax=Engystomops pustulosus TaxID=76066 RepID=UPI003AFA99D1